MAARERSTAYPSLSLEDALALVSKVRDGLGGGEVTRDQISPVIGHEKLTGPAASKIAALAHYGLLDKGKGTYRVSALATRILTPISEQEKNEALQEAALRPTLFAKVYEKYSRDGKLPTAIEAIIHREYGVTRDASKTARENLVSSFVFAGLLDNEGNFIHDGETGSGELGVPPAVEDSPATPSVPPTPAPPATYQVYELPMTHGTAKVILPPALTPKDFSTLESLVGLVEHFVTPTPAGEVSDNAQED